MMDVPGGDNLLKRVYGFTFPQEFYDFFDFYTANKSLIESALDVCFIGPFNILECPSLAEVEHPLWDARYYDDPPEFLTCATGSTDGLHWGLYIDDPRDGTYHVAYFYSRDAFEIYAAGSSMFEFCRIKLEQTYAELEEYFDNGDDCGEQLADLARLRNMFPVDKTGDRPEIGEEYVFMNETSSRQVVAATREYMGIVVPSEKYVPLAGRDHFYDSDEAVSTNQVQQWQTEAMDLLCKGYPGAALKLGKDLWIFRDHQEVSYALLDAAYDALDRPLLRVLLKDAMNYRAHCDTEKVKQEARKSQNI